MSAYIELSKLLNLPERIDVVKKFRTLEIYKLRGMAGSHTVDFKYDDQNLAENTGINRSTSFRLVQFYLEETGSEIKLLDENNITLNFNLLECLTEYEKMATDLLVSLIHHSINTLVKKKEQKNEMRKQLDSYLSNLLDYGSVNRNKAYREKKTW